MTPVMPVATATAVPIDWRTWVPCLGMALCSWLSFVDRQVLAILSPTILAETGLTAQDFTNAASFFFLAYTLENGRVKTVTMEQPAPQTAIVLAPVG